MKTVTLVHGLPDHAGTWEKVVPRLAGHFDDIRLLGLPGLVDGLALSENISLEGIADILARKLESAEPTLYVGHDFGAVLGALIASRAPELVSRLVLINGPSDTVLRSAIEDDPGQNARSRYAFRIAESPEKVLSYNEFAFLKAYLFRQENSPSLEYQESLLKLWAQSQVQRNIGTYYRAFLKTSREARVFGQPTLQLWSEGDPFIGAAAQAAMQAQFPSHTVLKFPVESHWPQLSLPDRVAQAIIDFGSGE